MDDKEGSKRYKRWYKSLVPRSRDKRSFLLSLIPLVVVLTILVLEYVPRVTRFEVGKPSTETVISSRDFSIIDEKTTEEAREEERSRIKGFFIDQGAQAEAVSRLGDFFNQARALSGEEGNLAQKASELLDQEDLEVSFTTLETILTSSEEESLLVYAAAVDLLTSAMSDPVSYDNVEEMREEIFTSAESLALGGANNRAAAELAQTFLSINTDYSSETIYRDMDAAASAVKPVYVNYTAGQKLVEKGEIINPLILASLNEAGALSPVGTYQQVAGIVLLVLALYVFALFFFKRLRPRIAGNWRIVAMICLVFTVFCLMGRLFSIFADENPLWGYLIPLALIGLALTVLLDHLVALFMVVVGGVVTGLFVKGNFYLTIAAVIGGLAGALLVTRVRNREDLMRAAAELSLIIAAVSMITASLINDLRFVLMAGALGVGNGVLCALLTLGSLPVLERLSGITTPMRLLELASPDQPLMKELISKAPGTYSHSVIVGNLADAAAREIGADSLLARVGSYYHDIGKIKRSTFFVENQPQGFNGHDKLKPQLSALVITAHVREGVDLAQQYRLPYEIADIIKQHHGSSLIRYFYARALEENENMDSASEGRFRYPGEKPQSKEAAIVMLSDAIEAAAKAMDKPTPAKLDQLIRAIIEERLEDGQLSESNLTMGDLDKITRAFLRILSSMYHERVEYPALVRGENIS